MISSEVSDPIREGASSPPAIWRNGWREFMGRRYHVSARDKPVLTFTIYCRGMAYEFTGLDATLSAAAGDDRALQAELRSAFVASVRKHADLLGRARCDGNWLVAALRLRTIAATFHAQDLLALADTAVASAPGDPRIIRLIQEQCAALEQPAP